MMTHTLKMKSKWAVLPIALSSLMLAACSNNDTATTGSETTVADGEAATQTLRIATESTYKPLSYTDADGKLIGFEIDLMNALCEEMKAECKISSQEWDGLIPGLQAQKFDAVIAGMSITPDRLEVVDFTDPYFNSGVIFVAKKGDDISLDSDLTGVNVGAQRSTVSSQYLEEHHPGANINMYDTQENAYLDLMSGRTRAILSDKVIAVNWLTSEGGDNFEKKGEEVDTGNDAMGIAVRKGDALAGKFNTALAALKTSGKYDEISDSYFGTVSTAAAQTAAQ